MKVNVKKTKAFCTNKRFTKVYSCKFSCPICGKGVGRNSIMCVDCKNWVHKRCSGIKGSIAKAKNFKCKRCQGFIDNNLEERLTTDGDDIEIVDKFPYLGDVLSKEGGVHEAITARIRSAGKNLRRFLVYYARAFHLELRELYTNAMLEAY